MSQFSPIQTVSLREQVVEQVRTAIIEGRLKPHDHIVEKSLTDQLGVSRTPVREALILLEREGLIVSIPNRGSFVREFTEADVDAIFSMRTTLENFAAELVIDRLNAVDYTQLDNSIVLQDQYVRQNNFKMVRSTDMAFHQYFVDRTGHPLLIKNWGEIVAQIAALLYLRAEAMPDFDELSAIKDHTSILDAYKSHEVQAVCDLNKQINSRVANECRAAIRMLGASA